MALNRRELMAMGGVVAGLGADAVTAAERSTPRAGGEHPKGLTYATIHSAAGGLGLGMRTARGVLDVAAYEKAAKRGLPLTVEAVINKRGNLAALVAAINGAPAHYFIAESAVRFGPVVARLVRNGAR